METLDQDDSSAKKRDIKDTDKTIESAEEVKVAQPAKKKKKNKKNKGSKPNLPQEIAATPLTEEEIQQRFKGSFLETLKFSSFLPLINAKGRVQCPHCKSNKKFYCYCICTSSTLTQEVPNSDLVKALVPDVPRLKFPVNITILKHPGEKMEKSSIIASKILAPESVTIHNSVEVCLLSRIKNIHNNF